jgi:phage gpG-like protein
MRVDIDVSFQRQMNLKEIVGDTVREAAEELREEAKQNAPARSGELKSSIRITRLTERSAKVGSKLIYAPVHEFGGTIRPKKGKVMRYQINGRWVTLRGVTIKESRYLRNAAKEVNRRVPRIAERVMKEKGFI